MNEPTQRLKALLVEDQPMLVSTLTEVLTTSGIDVVAHAYDLPAALAWLDRGLIPDVALIDVMLPSGPAYPLVDRLRGLPTAILLMTGMACEQLSPEYEDLPCLEKPFGVRDLLEAIAALG